MSPAERARMAQILMQGDEGMPGFDMAPPRETADADAKALAETGWNMTPVPAIQRAYNDPSIANLTDAGVQSAMMIPTMRGIKAAAGIFGAGLGGLAGREVLSPDSANAQAADVGLLKSRMGEIDARQREIDANIASNIGNKKLSRAQTEAVNSALRAEKEKLGGERTGLLDRIAGQTRADQDAATKAEADRVLAGKPFSQRHPDLSKVLMAGSYPLAGVLGYGTASKVLGNVGAANKAAEMAKDPMSYALARATADGLSRSAPYKVAGGAAAAAALPAEMQFLPDLVDYKLMPHESEAYKAAQSKFADPMGYMGSLAAPLLGGALMAGAGAGKRWAVGSERERAAAMKFIDGSDGQKAIAQADEAISNQRRWSAGDAQLRAGDAHSAAIADQQRRLELEALKGIGLDDLPEGVMPQVRANLGDGLAQKYPAPANPAPQTATSANQPALPPPVPPANNAIPPANGQAPLAGLDVDAANQLMAKLLQAPAAPTRQLPPGSMLGDVVIPQGVKPNPNWAQHSRQARDFVDDHIVGGGNMLPARGATRDQRIMTAPNLHAALDNPSFNVKTTQASLARLRSIMEANGTDLANVSRADLAKLKNLPPEYFAVPAAVGGAAAMSEDEMAREAMIRQLMQGATY